MASIANVLVVEDDQWTADLMAALLEDMGYTATCKRSGDEALAHLRTGQPCDVVLTDIVMPGMDGIELMRYAMDARATLPVILVSGKAEGVAAAWDMGKLALTKPITRTRLNSVLQMAIRAEPEPRRPEFVVDKDDSNNMTN